MIVESSLTGIDGSVSVKVLISEVSGFPQVLSLEEAQVDRIRSRPPSVANR